MTDVNLESTKIEEAPLVSIVIRAYNEAEFIGELLDGISRQDYPRIETILVDSGSTDGTIEIARGRVQRLVQLEKEAFSFGHSLNLGCEAAAGRILVFASAHVYPTSSRWISELVAPLIDGRSMIAYGRQVGDHRTSFSENRVFDAWFPDRDVDDQQTAFCNNANCAILREWWLRQPYDPSLTGLEDLAWAEEAKRKGAKISYRSAASVAHIHQEPFIRIWRRYEREAIAFRRIHPEAHFNLLDFFHLFISNAWSDCWAAVSAGAFKVLPDILRFRFAQYAGTYRGYRKSSILNARLREIFYYPPKPSRGR